MKFVPVTYNPSGGQIACSRLQDGNEQGSQIRHFFFSTAASFPRSRASKLFSPDLGFAASLLSDNLMAQARERKIKRAAAIAPKEFTIFRFRIELM